MKKRKEKEFKIRTYLTGIIWLALACSMIISALLFAFLKHFLEMPENIPAIVWLLIFNTMIAGLITALLNRKVLEPITKLSEAIPGLFVGCIISNTITGSAIRDILFGSLATLMVLSLLISCAISANGWHLCRQF